MLGSKSAPCVTAAVLVVAVSWGFDAQFASGQSLSIGCSDLNNPVWDGFYSGQQRSGNYSFNAGEIITITAGPPDGPVPTSIRLSVNPQGVLGNEPYPGTLVFVVQADFAATTLSISALGANATFAVSCTAGGAACCDECSCSLTAQADCAGQFFPGVTTCSSTLCEGTACGSDSDTECDNADTCNSAGACQPNNEPNGTGCTPDTNQCTNDVCASGVCTHPNSLAGTACGSGASTPCNGPDSCNGQGECLSNAAPAGQPCEDGNACTDGEACNDGVCTGGAQVDCNDNNDCTTDSCNPDLGCQNPCTDEIDPVPVGGCPPEMLTIECGVEEDPGFDPTFEDNCDNNLQLFPISSIRLGDCLAEGFVQIIDRDTVARDDCGNEGSCSQIVHFVDTLAPQIMCPERLILECGQPEGVPADDVRIPVAIIDECDTDVTVIDDRPEGFYRPTCGRQGPTRVTFTATDDCGNQETCVTEVEVFGEMCCPGTMDGDLTLMPVSIDLRQDTDGPVTTKAKFDIWNENEVRFSGTERCISCWDQTLLSRYNNPNHLLMRNIHTDKGKARIDGIASGVVCDISTDIVSVADPLLGVLVKEIQFDGLPPKTERTAINLPGTGRQNARIVYDQPSPAKLAELQAEAGGEQEPGELSASNVTGNPTLVMDIDDADFPSVESVAGNLTESRASITEKGSVLYYPNVEIKWDALGNVIQDTFIELSNDYPESVYIQLYFVNGDPPADAVFAGDPPIRLERAHPGWNKVDAAFRLTPNEPTYWSVLTGRPRGLQPFTILDPGNPPGRPDLDPGNRGGRVLRGFIIGWAMNSTSTAISWNHLSGSATVIHYRDASAFDYKPVAFQCVSGAAQGTRCGDNNGALDLNGIEYDSAPDKLLMDFYTVGSQALSHPEIR